ncbi:uncharacterized protein BYT42DRAFT_544052 [Radiomyces spectabilis]|uniref:uncharacterized protein n=1 Tax=Radiomyces spectabilis TaxID=64574 RepID=UPI0022204506|nr:uncharacterized protein BYT42DRAFT_544052 [Radiomyces spectabilis]KAI8388824.1 hypothetical protein BYT42DRAFT_544052 [Radiomyces spectabilis]
MTNGHSVPPSAISNGVTFLAHPLPATNGACPLPVNGSTVANTTAGNGGNTNSANPEEISTIFVVGFPDDMQEREFQNMFIFSPGFEAATLKIPSKETDDDTAMNGNNSNTRKQIIGFAKFRTRLEAMEAKDILSGRKVDAEKGSVLKAEMAKKNLHTKRGLSNDLPSQQPPLPSQSSHQPSSLQSHSQPSILPVASSSYSIISQQQQQQQHASSQSQSLSQPPSQQQQQVSQPSSSTSQQLQSQQQPPSVPQQQQPQQQPAPHPHSTSQSHMPSKRYSNPNHASAYEAFYSVPALPSDLLPSNDFAYSNLYNDLFSPGNTPTASGLNDSIFASRAPSFDVRSGSMGDMFGTKPLPAAIVSSSSSSRMPTGFNTGHRFSSKSILDMDSEAHSLDYLSKSTPSHSDHGFTSMAGLFSPTSSLISSYKATANGFPSTFSPPSSGTGLSSVLEETYASSTSSPPSSSSQQRLPMASPPDDFAFATRFGELSINTNSLGGGSGIGSGLTSPGVTSPTGYRSFGLISGSTNPADQNPPCNTLYVGNLPPNTVEDELITLFQKCVGYKRLSFRQKSNGPMCFVEFDDVVYATQALQELNGQHLSNSLKGGIRLSFSKNPLGIRQSTTNGSTNNMNSGISASNHLGHNFGFNNSLTMGNYPFMSQRETTFDPELS